VTGRTGVQAVGQSGGVYRLGGNRWKAGLILLGDAGDEMGLEAVGLSGGGR
jgi:hypothetical protein